MSNRLEGRVALITGAGTGIGQAIAVRLASEGAAVAINYVVHPEQAQETQQKVTAVGGKSILAQGDVSSTADMQRVMDQVWSQLGKCDVLVNNAGIEKGADFWDVTEADYDAVLHVNLRGPFFLTQFFVRKLLATTQPGRVINISSVHEDMVFPHFASYAASKGGLRMLMRNLAVELGPHNITVNDVAPGAIATPINAKLLSNKELLDPLLNNIPLGRMGKPEDVAGLVAFLASDDAAYITGSTYVIDGGLMRNYKEQ